MSHIDPDLITYEQVLEELQSKLVDPDPVIRERAFVLREVLNAFERGRARSEDNCNLMLDFIDASAAISAMYLKGVENSPDHGIIAGRVLCEQFIDRFMKTLTR